MGPLGNDGEKTGTHLIGPFTSLAFLSRKCGRGPPWTLKNSTSGSGGSENIKKKKRQGNGGVKSKVALQDAMKGFNPESEISTHRKDSSCMSPPSGNI